MRNVLLQRHKAAISSSSSYFSSSLNNYYCGSTPLYHRVNMVPPREVAVAITVALALIDHWVVCKQGPLDIVDGSATRVCNSGEVCKLVVDVMPQLLPPRVEMLRFSHINRFEPSSVWPTFAEFHQPRVYLPALLPGSIHRFTPTGLVGRLAIQTLSSQLSSGCRTTWAAGSPPTFLPVDRVTPVNTRASSSAIGFWVTLETPLDGNGSASENIFALSIASTKNVFPTLGFSFVSVVDPSSTCRMPPGHWLCHYSHGQLQLARLLTPVPLGWYSPPPARITDHPYHW